MAAYHSTVITNKQDHPDGSDAKAHHVKNSKGLTVKYRNPHPSFGPLRFFDLFVTQLFV